MFCARTEQTIAAWKGMNGQQGAIPPSLPARWSSSRARRSRRWAAGAGAVVENKARDPLAQSGSYRELSSNLAHDAASVIAHRSQQANPAPAPRMIA
jgi:hypothetical protein